jgi:hypothetical protein
LRQPFSLNAPLIPLGSY